MTVRVLNIAKTKYFQQIQCLQDLIYVIVILHRLLVLNISFEKKRKNINCTWNYSSNNFNIAINIEKCYGVNPIILLFFFSLYKPSHN